MIVKHWARSGVAWVFWRIRELVTKYGTGQVDCSFAVINKACESYGLDGWDRICNWSDEWFDDAEILHYHHDYVWQRNAESIRARFPKAKVVVTVHGEPDRTRARQNPRCVGIYKPDAYHVVEPGLLSILPQDVPATCIPNHPARGLASRPIEPWHTDPKILFVPATHVPQYKDHALKDRVALRLIGSGAWCVQQMPELMVNDKLLEALQAGVSACWVQFQGYIDILTMECWSLGVVPVTGAIGWDEWETLRRIVGSTLPPLFPKEEDSIAEAMMSPDKLERAAHEGRRFMQEVWTEAKAARLWEEFYEEVLAR